MKTIQSVSKTLCAISAAALIALVGMNNSSAVEVGIEIGTPPPAPIVEHPWAAPSPDAVWVAGHYHWVGNRWVWYSGYYTYPPRPHAVWVGPVYEHHDHYVYHDGYWR